MTPSSPNLSASTVFEDGSSFTFPLSGMASTANDSLCEAALPPAVAACRANYSVDVLNPELSAKSLAELQAAVVAAEIAGIPLDWQTMVMGWGFSAVANIRNDYGYKWVPSYGQQMPASLAAMMELPGPAGCVSVSPVPPFGVAGPTIPLPAPSDTVTPLRWFGGAAPGKVGAWYEPAAGESVSPAILAAGTDAPGATVLLQTVSYTMFGAVKAYVITALA